MNSPITRKSFILSCPKDKFLFSWGRQFRADDKTALPVLKGSHEINSYSSIILWEQHSPWKESQGCPWDPSFEDEWTLAAKTSQEHVSSRELGAREQDPKSRQMAFQASFRGQQRKDSQADFQSQTLRLLAFGKRKKEKNESKKNF